MINDVDPTSSQTRSAQVGAGSGQRTMLVVLLAGQVMASMDGSIVSVAAPTIRDRLGAGDANISLITSGYIVTLGVLMVTCARLGDVIGHRRAYLIGLAWFTASSLLCGLSVDPTMLIMARISQAVGAALLMPQVFSLIHRGWSGAGHRRAIGLYSMVLALGVGLGQIVGGLVAGTDLLGLAWRPVFLINVPVGIVVFVLGLRLLPPSQAATGVRLDPVGVVLLSGAMTGLTIPLVLGRDHGWPVWTWVMLIMGLILLGLFIRYEFSAAHPVLDFAALRPPDVRLGLASCCLVMGCYGVSLLTLTLHLQSQLGFSPLRAGLTFVPYAVGFGVLSLTWSVYPQILHSVLPVVGPLGYGAGVLLVVFIFRDHWSQIGAAPLLLLAGAGHAAAYSPLIARISARVDARLASAVSALNSTGPLLAEAVGIAGLGGLYFAAPTSSRGLLEVAIAVSALLLLAAGCAAPAVLIGRGGDHQR